MWGLMVNDRYQNWDNISSISNLAFWLKILISIILPMPLVMIISLWSLLVIVLILQLFSLLRILKSDEVIELLLSSKIFSADEEQDSL
tara:strand:+ start:1723 stop:1986 length:264 start_codon:yes stop_codon:yes gene_type:complete